MFDEHVIIVHIHEVEYINIMQNDQIRVTSVSTSLPLFCVWRLRAPLFSLPLKHIIGKLQLPYSLVEPKTYSF